MSSSSGSTEKEIDEYQDETNGSSASESSSNSSSQDENYSFRVPGIPLKVFYEEMQRRVASGAKASSSRRDKLSSLP